MFESFVNVGTYARMGFQWYPTLDYLSGSSNFRITVSYRGWCFVGLFCFGCVLWRQVWVVHSNASVYIAGCFNVENQPGINIGVWLYISRTIDTNFVCLCNMHWEIVASLFIGLLTNVGCLLRKASNQRQRHVCSSVFVGYRNTTYRMTASIESTLTNY